MHYCMTFCSNAGINFTSQGRDFMGSRTSWVHENGGRAGILTLAVRHSVPKRGLKQSEVLRLDLRDGVPAHMSPGIHAVQEHPALNAATGEVRCLLDDLGGLDRFHEVCLAGLRRDHDEIGRTGRIHEEARSRTRAINQDVVVRGRCATDGLKDRLVISTLDEVNVAELGVLLLTPLAPPGEGSGWIGVDDGDILAVTTPSRAETDGCCRLARATFAAGEGYDWHTALL
jgi:hypothetical protein